MSASFWPIIGQHLLISLVPWLVGITAGGGLGYACALVIRSLFSALPDLRRPSMLLPWRTVATALVLLFPTVPVLTGLGTIAGATMVVLFVFACALPFTASSVLECWHPSPLVIRLIAGARTLTVTSVVVATLTPLVAGSGGAGAFIQVGWGLADYPQVLRGFAIVVLLSLIVDVLLGTLQLGLSRTRGRFKRGKARSVNHAIPMPPNE